MIEITHSESFADVLGALEADEGSGAVEWGESRPLEVGTIHHGWWRGQDEWNGDYGPCPVYLMTDPEGVEFFFYGGRAQLDKKIRNAAPEAGDKVAVERLEDGPAEPGKNPPWRVRVAAIRAKDEIPF